MRDTDETAKLSRWPGDDSRVVSSACESLASLATHFFDVSLTQIVLRADGQQEMEVLSGGEAPAIFADILSDLDADDLMDAVLIVQDVRSDPRCRAHPRFEDALNFRSFAGLPLINGEAETVGCLCIIDRLEPISLDRSQTERLRDFGNMALEIIRARQAVAEAEAVVAQQTSLTQALRDTEERFQDFTDASADWHWEVDEDLRFTAISEKVVAASGNPVEWYLGRKRTDILPEFADSEVWDQHLETLARRGPFRDLLYCRPGPNGMRWLRSSGVPFFDEEGRFRGYRGIVADITTEVELEQIAKEALKATATAAESANRAKSEFLAQMSHELRTPLNGVLGFAQLLERLPETPEATREDWVRSIIRAGEQLLELINKVLELSRIESGHIDLSVAAIDPRPCIETALDTVAVAAADAGVTIIDRTERDRMPAVLADQGRLVQILNNLLSNAVKYNERGGRVIVSSEARDPAMLAIRVTDNGIGIPADRLSELFKPFSRLGRQDSGIEGTGIGLTITRQFVEGLGGKIGFESPEGGGSCFWFTLPLAPPATAADQPAANPGNARPV